MNHQLDRSERERLRFQKPVKSPQIVESVRGPCPVKVAQGPVVSLLLKIPAYSDSVAWRVKILRDSDLSAVGAAVHCFKHQEQGRQVVHVMVRVVLARG